MSRILLVDDEEDTRASLSKFLRAAGHEVVAVPNGRDALAEVLKELPDVVILDLVMPEMDGACFLEVIRSYLRLQSLPVVILTGLGDSPMIARAQALKVNGVLIKGKASPDDIVQAVEAAIVRYPG